MTLKWETDFYPVPVLGRIARSLSLSLSLAMRFPDCSPVLDKNRAPMGPEILSSTGAGVCRKAPKTFPDSSSVVDEFQSARKATFWVTFRATLGETLFGDFEFSGFLGELGGQQYTLRIQSNPFRGDRFLSSAGTGTNCALSILGTAREPPTRTTCLKSTGSTPPICAAAPPPFVTLCLAGF